MKTKTSNRLSLYVFKNHIMKILIYIVLVFNLMLLFACNKKEVAKDNKPQIGLVNVKLHTVGSIIGNDPILASGIVASESEVRMAFKTGGVIEKEYVEEGSVVRKGQLLAKLNMTEIAANVAQVNEQVTKLERDLARVKNLYRDSVATLEQLQNVTTALNVAKQSLSIANFNQQYSDIRATTNGRIVKRIMNEGELVAPGMPVFYLVADNANDWVVRVGVSDKDWFRLKTGDVASVKIDAFGTETFSANVHKLAASIDPTSGLYQIEMKLKNCNKPLVPGLFSNVKILPSKKIPFLSIPIEALIEGNNTSAYTFVYDNGKARKIEIKTNGVQGGEVLITSGLQAGQQVITDGSAYLSDGCDVQISSK